MKLPHWDDLTQDEKDNLISHASTFGPNGSVLDTLPATMIALEMYMLIRLLMKRREAAS